MKRCNFTAILLSASLMGAFSQPATALDIEEVQNLWENFNHYTLTDQVPQAGRALEGLLANNVSGSDIISMIDSADLRYQDVENLLNTATRYPDLATDAEALAEKIQQARVEQARDIVRIREDLNRLNENMRVFNNAVIRLQASGQFAAPYVLEILNDTDKEDLHPYVLRASIHIGAELAYPLSEAMTNVSPRVAGQIAYILGEVGEVTALPYLYAAAQREDFSETECIAFENAITRISNQNRSLSVASDSVKPTNLFTSLANLRFEDASRGVNPIGYEVTGFKGNGSGVVWRWQEGVGLTFTEIPASIYADVLAMEFAEKALKHDASNSVALTLQLAANLRRENRLQSGERDDSYSDKREVPSYYARLAGPQQQQDILAIALSVADADLALDAIHALGDTYGTLDADVQNSPLLACLVYGDARVRYSAAIALANASHTDTFSGSDTIVPILAQAILQNSQNNIAVVSSSHSTLVESIESRGAGNTVGATNIRQAWEISAAAQTNIDLLVFEGDLNAFTAFQTYTQSQPILRTVPVLAIVDGQTATTIGLEHNPYSRITTVTLPSTNSEDYESTLSNAIELAIENYRGATMSTTDATSYAEQAIDRLKSLASSDTIFTADVAAVRPQLAAAALEGRPTVAPTAASILALYSDTDSQEAVLGAALRNSGAIRNSQLHSLADSAMAYGNLLTETSFDALLKAAERPRNADEAVALSSAIGALSPSSSRAAEFVLKETAAQ